MLPNSKAISKTPQPNEYVPKENERHLYHVELEKPAFDPNTAEKISPKAYVQMFSVKEWKQFEEHNSTLGYQTKVLWNPEEPLKDNLL